MKTSPALPFDLSNIEPVDCYGEGAGMSTASGLRAGDVFWFRTVRYLCLANVANRNTPAINVIVAIPVNEPWPSRVIGLRLYVGLRVMVDGHVPIELEEIVNTQEEIVEALKS